MKKANKILNLMLVIILLTSTLIPVLSSLSDAIAATYIVQYNRKS